MKKLVAFNGSPRKKGNTSILLEQFIRGAESQHAEINKYHVHDLDLAYCKGCLRCNVLGYCSIRNDDWNEISVKIHDADVLVFASPIYFHHVAASLKTLIDRFRSFIHVQITETGLIHTPHLNWAKEFVLILTMGSSDPVDANPVIDLFKYIISILGNGNRLHIIKAQRTAVVKQIQKTEEELISLYKKMNIPDHLALQDFKTNQRLLKDCYQLGIALLK